MSYRIKITHIPFIIALYNMKYLEIDLAKDMKYS